MLAEMQSKLSQAVGLYGQILDGQQAYSARRMQEQQQRQYQQYNPPQSYQPYGYDNRYTSPVPQANGYASYAPQYQPPPQAAGPSLYPSIPQGQPAYTPQIYQPPPQAQYQPPQVSQPYGNGPYAQSQASSPPPQQTLDRHQSMRIASGSQLQPPQPQRHASMPYTHEPQGYAILSQPTGETAHVPSAPPPVDLASHPSTSPQSVRSALPSAPTLSSPSQATAPMPDATRQQQMPPQSQPESSAQQWHQKQLHQYPQQQQNPTPHQAQSHAEQPPQHVYYPQSFPQAPAAVFPDAPSDEINKSVEKEEQKEALLIEL